MSFRITLLLTLLCVTLLTAYAQNSGNLYSLLKRERSYSSNNNLFSSSPAVTSSFDQFSFNRLAKSAAGFNSYQLNGTMKDGPADNCSNWLYINTNNGAFLIGDLDVPGNKITVEATFNRTQPPSQTDELYAGDIVSKHKEPTSVNYLLRPNTAEITTDKGYFRTPDVCNIELNKTYHVAMTYDGATLKFYRNGFLMSAVPASGNLYQNDFITTIGNFASQPGFDKEGILGYINEVRIWNIVRTQAQLNEYLDKPLPNPSAQSGLLAYYTFDDLRNKQGNTAWNGKLVNGASINATNPTCDNYVRDSCEKVINPPVVIPSFTLPDTVCVNTPVHINNTTNGGSNFYWNFCNADLKNTLPVGKNLGNVGGALTQPVFMDLASENGKYYVFLTNHYPGGLARLDFGNSYLNTPKATSLGNFEGIIPSGYGTEGIQVVKNDGKWYAIIVAGSPPNNVPSRVIKIELGTSIENPAPKATDWGNIGDMSLPIDFYMFKNNDQWYGFTVNAYDNTITRIAFTNSFDNKPSGTNLGNVGNLFNYPTGVHAVNNEGNWSLFVTNANSNKLVRLDFGNSLLNTPSAKDLGSFNNSLNAPRDITIMESCESIIGYIVNGNGNDIVQIDFNNNFNNIPTGKSLGNVGNLSFPHSISKLFRVDNDVYSFIANVNNNTITRLKFEGCTSSNIAGSSLQNPPDVVYDKPGIYNVSLSVDEGLATQSSVCRQVVVLAPPTPHATVDTAFCAGGSISLNSLSTGNNYLWNTGAATSNITVTNSGKYWVTTNIYGCKSTDSFYVSKNIAPQVALGNDTALCKGDSLIVYAKNTGSTYLWQDGSQQDSLKITAGGVYAVAVTNTQGCTANDTIEVSQLLSPVISELKDQTICKNDVAQLAVVSTGTNNTFVWQPNTSLSALNIANPKATPADTTKYYVAVKNESGCITTDSVSVNVVSRPTLELRTDTSVCKGSAVTLAASAVNATVFHWSPAQSLDDNTILNPVANPTATTTYTLSAGNDGCNTTGEVTIHVWELPVVKANNDTVICGSASAQLAVTGAVTYSWFPAIALNNANVPKPVASPQQTIMYHVKGTDSNGCSNEDSVKIVVAAKPVFSINPASSKVCIGDSVLVTSTGGNIYEWSNSPDILQPYQASTYIKPSTNSVYKVAITNSICNVSDTLYTNISTTEKPIIQVSHSNDIDCVVNNATLHATGANTYSWTPTSTLLTPNTASPVAMPVATTVYHVKATDANNCVAEDSVTVKVTVANRENAYQMASAFTPNGDGINDCFGIKKWSIVNLLDFSIYNRWGALIFHSNNAANCWDGTYKGVPQSTGAYIYIIKAVTFCGNIYKKGTVMLIR